MGDVRVVNGEKQIYILGLGCPYGNAPKRTVVFLFLSLWVAAFFGLRHQPKMSLATFSLSQIIFPN